MTTEAQRKASAKYDKNHTKAIVFKFNTTNDADILAKLEEVGNKQGYVKNLIREDIYDDKEIPSIDAIGLMILPVIHRYGIKKVALFGSYARGEATENSDIDFIVETDHINDMKTYLSLIEHFRSATGKNVDIVMADALRSDNSRSSKRLMEHIERDKVIIYDNNMRKR